MGGMRQVIIPIFGGFRNHDNSPEVLVLEHETDSYGFLPFPDPRGGGPTALRPPTPSGFRERSNQRVKFILTGHGIYISLSDLR